MLSRPGVAACHSQAMTSLLPPTTPAPVPAPVPARTRPGLLTAVVSAVAFVVAAPVVVLANEYAWDLEARFVLGPNEDQSLYGVAFFLYAFVLAVPALLHMVSLVVVAIGTTGPTPTGPTPTAPTRAAGSAHRSSRPSPTGPVSSATSWSARWGWS